MTIHMIQNSKKPARQIFLGKVSCECHCERRRTLLFADLFSNTQSGRRIKNFQKKMGTLGDKTPTKSNKMKEATGSTPAEPVSIFSNPFLWSKQADDLYLKGLPAEEVSDYDASVTEVAGDSLASRTKVVTSNDGEYSMSSMSGIALTFDGNYNAYPDDPNAQDGSITNAHDGSITLDNGTSNSLYSYLPGDTSTKSGGAGPLRLIKQKKKQKKQGNDHEEERNDKTIPVPDGDDYDENSTYIRRYGDKNMFAFFRRAFEDQIFRRLIHGAVFFLLIFAILATVATVKSRSSNSNDENNGPKGNQSGLRKIDMPPSIIEPFISPSASPSSNPTPNPTITKTPSKAPTTSRPTISTPSPTKTPTISPRTVAPTARPSTLRPTLQSGNLQELIYSVVSSKTLDVLNNNQESPQYRALEWLVKEPFNSNLQAKNPKKVVYRWSLAVLFYSTGGFETWKNTTNWLSGVDECGWYTSEKSESVCDDDGYIRFLNLEANGLEGTLPSELVLLNDTLKYLHLDEGDIYGTIPSVYGSSFTKLEDLYLQGNELVGSIPEELSKMKNLERLRLEDNELTGEIPPDLWSFEKLRSLHLAGNGLRGTIPTVLSRIDSLTSLLLQRNKLTGTVPTWFGRLTNLRAFRLHDNRLVGSIPNEICSLVPASAGPLENLSVDCDLVTCTCGCQCN